MLHDEDSARASPEPVGCALRSPFHLLLHTVLACGSSVQDTVPCAHAAKGDLQADKAGFISNLALRAAQLASDNMDPPIVCIESDTL